MTIAHLEISTYQGISIGAIHWYAKLKIEDESEKWGSKSIEIERKMSAKEAKIANKELQARGFLSDRYKPGSLTNGFNTEEDAIQAGIQKFKSHYKGVLFLGDNCCVSAWKRVLFYPDIKEISSLAIQMNAISDEFIKNNGYEGDKSIAEKLDSKWYKKYQSLINLIQSS